MLCTECGTYAANKVLRKLGVYAEPAKVYTFDGKITDEDETNGNLANINGAPYWKFGVGSFDLNNIAKAEFCAQGTTVELVEFIVTTDENGVQTAVANIDGMELPAVVAFDGCLYGFCEGNAAYIAKISFAETIHPISDKYLLGPVVIDLAELGVMKKIQELMESNGGHTTLTIDPDKLWNKVRNAPQIICKFPFQENKSSGETFNAYLTGWYHVPATRMDFIETGCDAVSITFTFVAMNSFARVTLAQNVFGLSADENGLIYSDVTEVLLDLYPLTPAPGNY